MPRVTAGADDASGTGPAFRGPDSGSPSGSLHVVGCVRPGPDTRMDCDQPLRVVRRAPSGETTQEFWRCESYGCGQCSVVKARRLQRLVHDGIAHQAGTGLVGYFLTLTAPGTTAGHRRWVQGSQHRAGVARQVCGCEGQMDSLGLWNRQESACWNRLRTALARQVGSIQFCGSVETQKRGALHRHLVVFTDEPLFFDQVQELALAAGYGCTLDIEPLESPEKAARYLSKYVTKAAGDRAVVPWSTMTVDQDTGEIYERSHRPTYRLWSSSRRWGVTMKGIKAVQAEQARSRAMYLRELTALLADEGGSLAPVGAPESGSDPPG